MVGINSRVTLTKAPEWVGRVTSVDGAVAHVEFDAGGQGNFRLTDLAEAGDKAWPPAGIETK